MTNPDDQGPAEGFKPLQFLRCLFVGHQFRTSRHYPNTQTCTRCRFRKRG